MTNTTETVQLTTAHSPRLATVLMVEKTLQDAGGVIKISELKRRLPKKVMHATLLEILDYLQASGKVVIGTKGLLWVYAPKEELVRLIEKGLEGQGDLIGIEEIKRSAVPLLKEHDVRKAAVFGSFATGTAKKASDVDMLVEFSRPKGLEFVALKLALEEKLGRGVDLLTYASINPYIRKRVLKEAVEIL